jgi:hypothetical protein
MKARKRNSTAAGAISFAFLAAFLLQGCGGLPRALRQQIASEKENLAQAQKQFRSSQQTVKDDLAHSPELFASAKVKTEWPARLQTAQQSLNKAGDDLKQVDSAKDVRNAERLLADARTQRQTAVSTAQAVASDANSWLDFERNVPHYLTAMQHEYDTIHGIDLAPVATVVEKAETDWPAKKADLDGRLAALKQLRTDADNQWMATEAARKDAGAGSAKPAEIATLIEANDILERDADKLPHDIDELRAQAGQLYNSWDKVLADLDVSNRGGQKVYQEKINTVRTHYTDVAQKKTEVSSDSKWVEVPPSTYQSVENDLGMTIAHKDAGKFDSEAQDQVQPPGFAYIAPPSVGRNQYGYWSNQGGHSVWTWLPEYLIMRELLWGRNYQPIYINEYNGYQAARRSGQVYYGRETPSAPPKYGSHGTFTQQRYSSSRYVQSGGFASSEYASRPGSSSSSSSSSSGMLRTQPRSTFNEPDSSAGNRFGSENGQRFGSNGSAGGNGQRFGTGGGFSGGSGQRFGSRGGFSSGSGQRFGSPSRSAPSAGRRFGGSRRR